MRIMYYAEDGTMFEDRDECISYEAQKMDALVNFKSHMYDKDGDEVFLRDIGRDTEIDYFDIKTEEDLQVLREEIEDKWGLSVPAYTGQWYYNYDKDRWDSYEEYKGLYFIMKEIFEGE